MARHSLFSSPSHEPFAQDPNVHLKQEHTSAPFSFFNPTRARFHLAVPEQGLTKPLQHSITADSKVSAASHLPGVEFRWRSRDNRKGRHTLIIDADEAAKHGVLLPELTTTWSATLQGIKRMFTQFPVWDVSWLVAQFFTWGSLIFVLNGLFYWLPLVAPSSEFPHEGDIGGGVTSFVGTIFYEIGVVLTMLEAFNENRKGCFGWALEEALSHHDDKEAGHGVHRLVPKKDTCSHHHANKKNILGRPNAPKEIDNGSGTSGSEPAATPDDAASWVWFPSWHELTHHYFREMAFFATFLLFVSATVFWITGFASLPGVFSQLSVNATYGVFWTPDILGSIGFVVSSWLLMVETQPNWYTPAFHIIGWHANFWNLIGSVGFLLSGCFGVCSSNHSTCLYQSDLSTTWGSFFFLVGSIILWYESLDKYPVEVIGKKS